MATVNGETTLIVNLWLTAALTSSNINDIPIMRHITKSTSRLAIAVACLAAAGSASAAVTFEFGVTGTPLEEFVADGIPDPDLAFAGDVSDSDLLNGLTPTVNTGWNAGRDATRLVDGIHDVVSGLNFAAQSQTNATATFDLGTGTNGLGYDLTSLVSIASWRDNSLGNQMWNLEVAGVGSGVYSTLLTVDYTPGVDADGDFSTKVTITDISGTLASGVQFVRVNGDVNFVWQELDVFGTATAVPEPSSTALIGLAGLALILRRRR